MTVREIIEYEHAERCRRRRLDGQEKRRHTLRRKWRAFITDRAAELERGKKWNRRAS